MHQNKAMYFVAVTTEKQFAKAEEIIAPHEKFCVSLADKVRLRDKNIFLLVPNDGIGFARHKLFERFADLQNACGVIYLHNTLFHCLPFVYRQEPLSNLHMADFMQSLSKFLNGKQVSCISGTKSGSNFFMVVLKKKGMCPTQMNDYTLMSLGKDKCGSLRLDNNGAAFGELAGIKIQRVCAADCDALFNLHEGYMLEEVVPSCRTYSAAAARYDFLQTLKTCTEFFARNSSGKIVAKGGVHSEGQHHAQIGGIYTLPEERNKHFAQAIMTVLVAEIYRRQKTPTLFVKKINSPATAVYKKIGFTPECDYCIVYY